MRSIIIVTALALLLPAAQSPVFAESVGYNRIIVPSNSDAKLTLPFCDEFVASYTVDTVTGFGVTIAEALEENAFQNTHYARFVNGSASGLWSTISANGEFEIDLADINVLDQVSEGDVLRVYKHHTLGSVFPDGMYGKSYTNGTQVFIYANNIDVMETNKSSSKSGAYSQTLGHWVGAGVDNSTVIPPETQFILRNNSGSPLEMITLGDVPDYTVRMLIAPDGDLVIGSGYPVPVKLSGSGLEGNARTVFFYDNSAPGINKSSVKTATYSSVLGKWTGTGVTGNELIGGSEMITLRLHSTEPGSDITINRPY